MTAPAAPATPTARVRRDAGFTLVELLIAIVLSGVIGGVTVAAMATSLNIASSTSAEVADSTDAGLISAFLYRDAQAVGAPAGSAADTGVSTAETSSDWAGCDQDGAFVARFTWLDVDPSGKHRTAVASYALDPMQQLTRRVCTSAGSSSIVLGHSVTSAIAACAPDPKCMDPGGSVSLTLRGSGARAPFDYTLTASTRVEAHNAATTKNSASVSVMALGDPGSSRPCPNLTLAGKGELTVIGSVLVNADCGDTPIDGDPASMHATGSVSTASGVADPFATIAAPAEACSGKANPSPIGDNPSGGVVVYPLPVAVTGTVKFEAGTYIFCSGLDFGVGATVVGSDVFLVVAGGTFTVDERATAQLTASRAGPHANLLVWVTTAQRIVIAGGSMADTLDGYLYAPTSQVELSGRGAINLGGSVTQGITIRGSVAVRFGIPVPPVDVAAVSLPRGQVGVAFAPTQLTASGASQPYRWSAIGLASGLSLDPITGIVSGTPQSSGTFDIAVTAFDATSSASSRELSVVIDPPLTISGPASLPAGEVGVRYPSTVATGSGGTPAVMWSARGLPPGLMIDTASGTIGGTPTAAGSFTVVLQATDSLGTTASRSLPVTIALPLAITTASLPAGQVGVAYPATTMQSGGGMPAIVWSVNGLPAGLSMNEAGGITGTPTTPGSATVVVQAVDGLSASVSRTYTIRIDPPLAVGTASLPSGEIGIDYPVTTLTTTGGTAPFTWSATGLPSGIVLDPATGTLSGTPSTAGTAGVRVTVVDATSRASSATYSITIAARLGIAGPTTLPNGRVGAAYPSTAMTASGGSWPFTWSAIGLPAGLVIDGSSGVISGTPSAVGTVKVSVAVSDSLGASASADYTIQIVPALAITTASLPSTQLGAKYTTSLAASGGTPTYIWSATGLPPGLTVSPDGVISGVPTGPGTFSVAAKVVDSAASSATMSYSLVVSSVPYGCPSNPSGWRAEYFANISLSGVAPVCVDDAAINFDWGTGSPAKAIPVDNFSARWSRSQSFAAGSYLFSMGADDGSRLYIDGILVLDRWTDQGYPSPVPTVTKTLAAGNHDIVMEYYERGGSAAATLSWAIDTPVTCPANPSGWLGQYYNNNALSGSPVLCRDDAAIKFDWGGGSPSAAAIGNDNFSARWTQTKKFAAGTYTFALGTDDGGRLYIDGTLVLDRWNDQAYPSPQPSVSRTLAAGAHTLVVEYYERGGLASATLVQTP